MQDELSRQIEDAKTDEKELNSVLRQYDLDNVLIKEFDDINKQFIELEIKYRSLLNTRKFFNNG